MGSLLNQNLASKYMEKSIKLNDEKDYLYYREGSGGTLEIWDIAVTSKRRQGIGRELFKQLLEKENPTFVIAFTRGSNVEARAFYKALGFTETIVPKMYGEDAYLVTYENSFHR